MNDERAKADALVLESYAEDVEILRANTRLHSAVLKERAEEVLRKAASALRDLAQDARTTALEDL